MQAGFIAARGTHPATSHSSNQEFADNISLGSCHGIAFTVDDRLRQDIIESIDRVMAAMQTLEKKMSQADILPTNDFDTCISAYGSYLQDLRYYITKNNELHNFLQNNCSSQDTESYDSQDTQSCKKHKTYTE